MSDPVLPYRRPARSGPLVPSSLRSPSAAWATARPWMVDVALDAGFHLVRLPWYLVLTAVWSPVGVFRLARVVGVWASDPSGAEEVAIVRAAASANRKDSPRVTDSREAHHFQIALRCGLLAAAVAGVAYALAWYGPAPVEVGALFVAVLVALATFGKRGSIAKRAPRSKRTPRFTARLVTDAIASIPDSSLRRALGDNPAETLTFATDPLRGERGWEVEVDLPPGITAEAVTSRREALASGLRRPTEVVWPEPVAGANAGRVRIFVADRPLGQMDAVAWDVPIVTAVDLFDPIQIGVSPSGQEVRTTLVGRTWLVVGLSGFGKSYALRQFAGAAAADPGADLWIFECKGTGDLEVLRPICSQYRAGDDEEDIAVAFESIEWLVRSEFGRRADLILSMPDRCPDNVITREVVDDPDVDLRLLFLGVDELQTWFENRRWATKFEPLMSPLIKKARALGVVPVTTTQKPDVSSMPIPVRDNVTGRLVFQLANENASRMALGPGAGHWRADKLTEPGVGILVAEGAVSVVRLPDVSNMAVRPVAARALRVREDRSLLSGLAAGLVSPSGHGPDTSSDSHVTRAMSVWPEVKAGMPARALPSAVLVDLLAARYPSHYRGWSGADLSSALGAHLQVKSVKYQGSSARGVRYDDLAVAVAPLAHDGDRGDPAESVAETALTPVGERV